MVANKFNDVMMSIRVSKELRESFAKVCSDRNQVASKVIKAFMENYVRQAEAPETNGEKSNKQ